MQMVIYSARGWSEIWSAVFILLQWVVCTVTEHKKTYFSTPHADRYRIEEVGRWQISSHLTNQT